MFWIDLFPSILVSTKLPDPTHETGVSKLGFITILCLKFRAQSPKLKTGYRYENQFWNSGFTNREFCTQKTLNSLVHNELSVRSCTNIYGCLSTNIWNWTWQETCKQLNLGRFFSDWESQLTNKQTREIYLKICL